MTGPSRRRLAGGRLVVATHNPGKLREIEELVAGRGIAIVSAGSLGLPEPEETGATFAENARAKALAAARASGSPALADDSGLAVDALGGAPGVHSARWAGPQRDFAAAMAGIERRLSDLGATTPEARRARFVAVLCLAWPDGESAEFRGEVEGTLVWPPRGERGFGYDPVFRPDGHARTFGEMRAEEKRGPAASPLSHRARAFALFAREML